MNRLVVLAALVVAGIGLAVAGSAVGIDGVSRDGPASEFRVTNDTMTVSTADEQVELVGNTSQYGEIEVRSSDDSYEVAVTDRPAITDEERERAKALARNNETVREQLDRLDSYRLSVSPVPETPDSGESTVGEAVSGPATATPSDGETSADSRVEFEASETDNTTVVNASEMETTNVTVINASEAETAEFDIVVAEENESAATVRVDRQYSTDRVYVWVLNTENPAEQYRATVDLDGEQVDNVVKH